MSDKYPKLNIDIEALKQIDISKFQELGRAVSNTSVRINEQFNSIAALNNEKYQRELENHKALLQIADNTQGIKDLVSLVRQGNEINQQTFKLIQQLQTIMTAETLEEGETIIREVLEQATQAKEDIDTIQTLIGWGKMLLTLVFSDSSGL